MISEEFTKFWMKDRDFSLIIIKYWRAPLALDFSVWKGKKGKRKCQGGKTSQATELNDIPQTLGSLVQCSSTKYREIDGSYFTALSQEVTVLAWSSRFFYANGQTRVRVRLFFPARGAGDVPSPGQSGGETDQWTAEADWRNCQTGDRRLQASTSNQGEVEHARCWLAGNICVFSRAVVAKAAPLLEPTLRRPVDQLTFSHSLLELVWFFLAF